MAYLRKEQETFEIDYSLAKIWEAIPKAIENLKWTIEKIDPKQYQMEVKTTSSFMAYSSTLLIKAADIDKKTTRVTVKAETPVTTITSLADFGRTSERIENFFRALANQFKDQEKS